MVRRKHDDGVPRPQPFEDGVEHRSLRLERGRAHAHRGVHDERQRKAGIFALRHLGAHEHVRVFARHLGTDVGARLSGLHHAGSQLHHQITSGAHVGLTHVHGASRKDGAGAGREDGGIGARGIDVHQELAHERRFGGSFQGKAVGGPSGAIWKPLHVLEGQLDGPARRDVTELAAHIAVARPVETGAAIVGTNRGRDAEGRHCVLGVAFAAPRDASEHRAFRKRQAEARARHRAAAVEVLRARARDGELAVDLHVHLVGAHHEGGTRVEAARSSTHFRDGRPVAELGRPRHGEAARPVVEGLLWRDVDAFPSIFAVSPL